MMSEQQSGSISFKKRRKTVVETSARLRTAFEIMTKKKEIGLNYNAFAKDNLGSAKLNTREN